MLHRIGMSPSSEKQCTANAALLFVIPAMVESCVTRTRTRTDYTVMKERGAAWVRVGAYACDMALAQRDATCASVWWWGLASASKSGSGHFRHAFAIREPSVTLHQGGFAAEK